MSSFIQNKTWFTAFCIGWLAITIFQIRHGETKLLTKFNIEDKYLFEIVDDNNNHSHVIAHSLEEAELLAEVENLNGKINHIGKVKYFN